MRNPWRLCATTLAVALFVAACGGGDDNPAPSTPPAAEPDMTRGALLSDQPQVMVNMSAANLQTYLSSNANGQSLLAIAGTPNCGISVHEFEYATVGAADEPTNATGAIMAPTGDSEACSGPRPVLLYAHGTTTDKNYNIADIANSANAGANEGSLIAAMYAAQGFVVVAPNYAGYHKSKLDYHPYLHRDQQSKDMIDALAAARKAFDRLKIEASDKLLLSGYSQGGYVAMATHAALQEAGVKVTASAPLSGPYALAAFGDAMYSGNVNLGATIFVPMMSTAYQKAYGDIYQSPDEIYEARYASGIESLLPSTQSMESLFKEGKLPQTAIFSSTSPAPMFDSITPPKEPAAFADLFALGFGEMFLIKNEARVSYLQDAMANPDRALETGQKAENPQHPMRKALKDNDLRGWTPQSPVLMCGGKGDPTVFYDLNTTLMQRLWTAPSPIAPQPGMVTALDVDSDAVSGDPFAPIKQGFAQAKAAAFSQGGASGMVQAYHGGLVPPFCAAAARGFFQQVLTQ